ncbi:U2 snRNP complex subunit [Ophidiomyces ophidiicola]|nr:U2 snRNP complex subunit [Ophidiomyces ophidiicola]KAI1928630.1 U2 snRNP complex subunit [Ophidiomyces ophidiicola]KAI1966268.1 U2 snRNP complex subunit [Ophidiomyces ophidiicola]KAI1976387.1 U2 snRNP complex subunit [Ophidiomyces ophidiicola]KAI2009652.1 U2 snRNP complex subunit [Ophidiomyces ophidiicola]
MRLTTELIQNSLSYINPLKERELDLRGHRIPVIENLGVARDQDAIDFTDNDLSSISNFPFSPRLRSLLLARNRISHIQPTISQSIPNLTNLILTSNNITELADLEPLKTLTRLTHLSLLENPATRKEHYRHWVIWLLPSVRFLDFQKVKDSERAKAAELFGSPKQPSSLATKILGIKSRAFQNSSISATSTGDYSSSAGERPIRVKLTDSERKRVEKMIREAKSLQEIAKLERELNEGRIPKAAMDGNGEVVEMKM